MTTLPLRSPDVLVSVLDGQGVAYDLATEMVHHLNATALELLAQCDGTTNVEEAVALWSRATGTEASVITADVVEGLEVLASLGLVGRDAASDLPEPPVGSKDEAVPEAQLGLTHPVIDWSISFRSTQSDLLAAIDDYLGTGQVSGAPNLVFDVVEESTGEVVLTTDYEWRFPTLQACLNQLTSVLNEYAVWTHTCVTLHAGAVRSPSGDIILLPAVSGGGKSTLTGAFVAAGWDYLGDEAIGIRRTSLLAVGYPKRLAMDDVSRTVLGLAPSDEWDVSPTDLNSGAKRLAGDVGPIAQIVLPTFVADAELAVEHLEPSMALNELLANTLNLARAGQEGLHTLCELATGVPVRRLTHGDAHEAVRYLGSARV